MVRDEESGVEAKEASRQYSREPLPRIMAVLGAIATFSLIFMVAFPSFESSTPRKRESETRTAAETVDPRGLPPVQRAEYYLDKLNKAIIPARRERILNEMRADKLTLEPALLRILTNEHHPLIGVAAQAAAELEIEDARPMLLHLAKHGSPKVRYIAIQYGAGAAFSPAELEDVLRRAEADLVVQGLDRIDAKDQRGPRVPGTASVPRSRQGPSGSCQEVPESAVHEARRLDPGTGPQQYGGRPRTRAPSAGEDPGEARD